MLSWRRRGGRRWFDPSRPRPELHRMVRARVIAPACGGASAGEADLASGRDCASARASRRARIAAPTRARFALLSARHLARAASGSAFTCSARRMFRMALSLSRFVQVSPSVAATPARCSANISKIPSKRSVTVSPTCSPGSRPGACHRYRSRACFASASVRSQRLA